MKHRNITERTYKPNIYSRCAERNYYTSAVCCPSSLVFSSNTWIMGFWSDAGLRLGRGLMRRGAAEKDVIISEEDSVSAEDESDPLSSSSLSPKDDDESEEEDRVDEREPEGVPASFLSPGVRFLCDCSSNTPNPRFWRLVREGCTIDEDIVRTISMYWSILSSTRSMFMLCGSIFACCSRIALDASIWGRKVWTRASTSWVSYYLQYGKARHKIYIRSLGGTSGEVARSAKSNFSGRERILVDDEALSFSRLSSEW